MENDKDRFGEKTTNMIFAQFQFQRSDSPQLGYKLFLSSL